MLCRSNVAFTKSEPRAKPRASSVLEMQVCHLGVQDCKGTKSRVPRVSTDLWSEGLPPSLGLSLSAGQQMLAVPFLLQTPETSTAISQTTRSPEAKLQQKRHRQGTHSMLSSYSGYVPNSRPWISDVSFLLCLLIWGGRLWPTMVQMRRSEDNLQEPPR